MAATNMMTGFEYEIGLTFLHRIYFVAGILKDGLSPSPEISFETIPTVWTYVDTTEANQLSEFQQYVISRKLQEEGIRIIYPEGFFPEDEDLQE